jgi:hypothetical protein
MSILSIGLALTVSATATANASGQAQVQEKTVVVKDWKADPACRLVFFAVLQGLYEDGVPDEVVNNIVPPDKKGREKMRHSFVLDCPLCLPAFEAFCAYQARPRFLDEDRPAALGKGLPEDTIKGLMSKGVAARLKTLRQPIRKWVEARLISMKLTETERQKWWQDITARVGQGSATLRSLRASDPWYKDWSGYWGCAACLGSQDACQNVPVIPAIEPKK